MNNYKMGWIEVNDELKELPIVTPSYLRAALKAHVVAKEKGLLNWYIQCDNHLEWFEHEDY